MPVLWTKDAPGIKISLERRLETRSKVICWEGGWAIRIGVESPQLKDVGKSQVQEPEGANPVGAPFRKLG